MQPEHFKKIKSIVQKALELEGPERDVYINKVCKDNHALLEDVEQLLDIEMDDSFLEASIQNEINETEELSGQIGRIQIDRLIARGGMGEVYAGTDITLKRAVAIKVISDQFRLNETSRTLFLNEAQALSKLQHNNICQVYDYFESDGKDILVLELIEGETLTRVLKNQNKKNTLTIAYQIAKALVAAHEHGIIHRDLKPDNIMISNKNQVKVLDFGLARSDLSSHKSNPDINSKYTQVSGTPGYMSPEQARGEVSTTATDIWSFGIILCELFAQQIPYAENSSTLKLLENTQKAKLTLPGKLSSDQQKLIEAMLAPHASKRPTARQILNSIERMQNKTSRRVKISAILVSIIVVLFSAWKYTTDLQQQREAAIKSRLKAENLIEFMLDDLHGQLRAVGRLDLIESVANKAMNYYEHVDTNTLENSQGNSAIALVRLAQVVDERGRKDESIKLVKQAQQLLEVLHGKHPDNTFITYRLAFVENYLSDLLKITGEYSQALLLARRSISHAEQLTRGLNPGEGPKQQPTGSQRWYQLLSSMYTAADIYRRTDQNKKALALLERSLTFAIPAAKANPELKTNLANIYYKRCSIFYALKRKDVMLDACLASLEMDRTIHQENPDDFNLHLSYIADFDNVSNIYRNQGQLDLALQLATQGLKESRKLAKWGPDNIYMQNELVSSLFLKARLLHETGEREASKNLFEEGYKIIIPITKDSEELTYLTNKLYAQIYLGLFSEAHATADFLNSKGMNTRDLRELIATLNEFERKNTP